MKVGKLIIGLILLIIGIWLAVTTTNVSDGKIIGAAVLVILGVAVIAMAFSKKKDESDKKMTEVMEETEDKEAKMPEVKEEAVVKEEDEKMPEV